MTTKSSARLLNLNVKSHSNACWYTDTDPDPNAAASLEERIT
jgi:hypothetical protein